MIAVIRPATAGDLDAIVALCGEHAAFEHATFSAERAQAPLGELVQRVFAAAGQLGCALVEWQTPSWNRDAVRFYDRLGAVGSPKIRYRWRS